MINKSNSLTVGLFFCEHLGRLVAVYLRLQLKICKLRTRYKKCSVQVYFDLTISNDQYSNRNQEENYGKIMGENVRSKKTCTEDYL